MGQVEDRGARSLLAREVEAHPSRFSRVTRLHLRTAPLLLLAACFAAGVLCRGWWQPTASMATTCLLLFTAAAVARVYAPRVVWLAIAALWVALGWTAAVLEPAPQTTSLLPYADELQRTVEAQVVAVHDLPPPHSSLQDDADASSPAAYEEKTAETRRATQSLDLDVRAIEELTPYLSRMTPMQGGAHVTLFARAGTVPVDLPCGANIRLVVRLHAPRRYRDPGVWQYADELASRGIGVMSSADAAAVQVVGRTTTWSCRFAAAQHWSANRWQQLTASAPVRKMPKALRLSTEDAVMLSAMLFGDRTRLDRSLRTAFERTGTFHLFVVAGMHVALLLAFLFEALLRLRLPRWLAALIALSATTGYAVLTGFGAPVQRALLMCAVYLLTRLLGRGRSPLNALGAAALAMLVLHPGVLFETGFQMTVLVVLAIAGIAIPLCERTLAPYAYALRENESQRNDPYFPPRLAQMRVSVRWMTEAMFPKRRARTRRRPLRANLRQRMPAWVIRCLLQIGELLFITLVAEIVMALPMAMYFHRATPFAAPVNLLALPFVGTLMFFAIATFLFSLLAAWLAVIPAAITALLLHGVTWIVGTIGSLHGADLRVPSPRPFYVLASCAMWCAALYLIRETSPRAGRIACALVPAALLLVLWPHTPRLHHDALEFTAIDVGQGDSLLAASPQGRTMLIDAGGPNGSNTLVEQSNFDIGEEVVSPYLWSRGLRRLDVLVLTHAHSDHIGGMMAVMRNFRPRELWLSVDADAPALLALLQQAAAQGITVRRLRTGDAVAWGGASILTLSPAASYQASDAPGNDDSLAMRIAYGKASVLSEGDAEQAPEGLIVSEHIGPVTLLKAGHHGSNTSTTDALLQAVHPQAAVISCGLGNHFGHPRMQVLQRLQAAGVRTARTDEMGAVQYLLHDDGSIETHVLTQEQ